MDLSLESLIMIFWEQSSRNQKIKMKIRSFHDYLTQQVYTERIFVFFIAGRGPQ